MNKEEFTDRGGAYTKARPGYPDEAMEYIRSLVPANAVVADIGAGTGKFTELLARHGYKIYAVEPNSDMREQLIITLAGVSNTTVVDGSAEATTLFDDSVDVITCAQALNWFDIDKFKIECRRIGKGNPMVISLYNSEVGKDYSTSRYAKSTGALYKNPVVMEFPNPVFFTRDRWQLYFLSMAGVPLESDPGYETYMDEINSVFERDSVDGILRLDLITRVYSEKI